MKKTLVIGLGISGLAAVHYLLKMGKEVIAVDRQEARLKQIPYHPGLTLCLESEFHSKDDIEEVILSSGVRPSHSLVKDLPVQGEAELVLRECKQRCIGITGTNGKTTVTLLIEHILRKAGKPARALGNIGKPLAEYFLSPQLDEILVIELSSYQLETLSSPVFDQALILNITPDHLDQYASLEEYASAKCRLQKCMKPGSVITIQESVQQQYRHLLSNSYKLIETFAALSYRSSHETENMNAAWSVVKELGVSEEQFMVGMQTFQKPPHRIEFVSEVEGVSYFDDSKGTNQDAVIQAVKSMFGPVILIAGGVDKGSGYDPWIAAFTNRVKSIFVIGQASERIRSELSSYYEVISCQSLDEAVERSSQIAASGDCVLLSPGCASFDMFRDYAHRGQEFKRCVHNLRRKE